ncbi:unnamed protein product [Prorocentrum cordatum]|uniref:Endonuclease/exonuclease/phosphatase domain-containing protein n=1 Tax=Prorocentrum cordatum TaxID=2364126 RepID=A0ABN9PTE0_9DINO|nr:unnamed protein product [Polarella glacialis]
MQVPGAAGPAEPEAAAAWQAPLILGGDFNAQLSPQVARDTLESHPVFARARAEGRDADFLEYMSNGHRFLHDRGFRAAYYPAAPAADSFGEFVRGAPRVNATSVFGGVVDWIYLPASIASARRPSAVSIIDAIGTGVSDHQAVRASLHMPCAPLVGGEPEPSSSQVSFYEGLGTSVPTMVAHWVLYPIQVRQTREVAGSGAAHHEAGMRSKLLATFRSVLFHDQPGRVMSTFAVGFSTFTFWFTFYLRGPHTSSPGT